MVGHQHTSDYMAHGFCFAWEPGLVWLHVVSDIVTGIAYYSIPVAMFYFMYKRRDLPFYRMFMLFAIFILSCGTTHFFAAYTIFDPLYWHEGWVKAFTAVVSAISAILFIPMIPKAIALPSLTKALDEIKILNAALEKQVEELQVSEDRFRSVVNNVPIGVSVISPDMKVISVNPQMYKWYPELDVSKQPFCFKVFNNPPGESVCGYCPVHLTFSDGEVHEALTDTPSPEGTSHYRIISSPIKDAGGKVIAAIELVEDFTERKKLEAQLFQAQKMESIGTLAGGVAHDFNNMLNVIMGYSSILQMKLAENDPLRVNVDHVLSAAEKAAALTSSLLAFSRKQPIRLQPVNLIGVIKDVEKFLGRIIGADVEIQTTLRKDILTVNADKNQIEQVLMNMATNSRDAMPHGGTFSIIAESVEIDMEYIKAHGYGEPGLYALIILSDTGAGMDAETTRRIFEPFFTTKEVGKGTGLGLAIVYGIVKQHNGYLNVYSEQGKGTTFKIYLPLLETGHVEKALPAPPPLQGGMETILVAEDDAAIRALTKGILTEFGYTVIEAVDGMDAIDKFSKNKDRIDLLLLDMIMPKKHGKEVYDEIRQAGSDVKVIFVSGYPVDFVKHSGDLGEEFDLLLKPITPQTLLLKVREVLDTARK